MDEKKFFEVTIQVEENNPRKAAFAEGINRGIDFKKVQEISDNIKIKGYRRAEVVQVLPAEEVNEEIELTNINGKPIKSEDRENYYLVLDGQHRVYATSQHNEWLLSLEDADVGNEIITIPGIIVELVAGETISEYINEINITKKEWIVSDYVRGAANVFNENDLLQTYKDLIKCDSNPDGYPISVLNLIFCGDSGALSKKDLYLLSKGCLVKSKGKETVSIIPAHNLPRGNKFLSLCRSKGFKESDIAKRYLIGEFRSISTSYSVKDSFKVFEAITPEDKDAMLKKNGSIDPVLLKQQLSLIIDRLGINGEDFED